MMFIKRISGCIACMVLLFMSACVLQQEDTMTHKAQIQVDPANYPLLLKSLDLEMAKFGLIRTGADAGLNALKDREVLFGVYHTKPTDNWWFLSVHDIGVGGTVDVRVYARTLKDESVRKAAVLRVNVVLAVYGAQLQAKSPE
jgi:hypothetical protein